MSEGAQKFPLTWPVGWRRTPAAERRRAQFKANRQEITVAVGFQRLLSELRLLGADAALISTNVPRAKTGQPMSSGPEPADPGVAVYFKLKGQPRSLACDSWRRVGENMAAIAAHIDALRRIDRYGVGTLEQAFAGYAALPAWVEDWWTVLGVERDATLSQVEDAYKKLARAAHPDAGGSDDAMARLNAARAVARRSIAQ